MQFYTKKQKKITVLLSTFSVDLITILLYIKVVCVVSIKQAWYVVVITSGNNTMLLEIS